MRFGIALKLGWWYDCFNWPYLKSQGSKLLESHVIFERSKIELKCTEIIVTEAKLVILLAICHYVLCIIVYLCYLIRFVESSHAINLSYLSPYHLEIIFIPFLFQSLLHLLRGLGLLSYCYFVTFVDELLNIFFEVTLMEANHSLHLPGWDTKIKNFAWNHRILEVNYEPFTPTIKDYFVIILALNFPIPLHTWSHFLKVLIWDFNGSRIIVWVFRSSSLSIAYIFSLGKPRTIFYFIYKFIHVLFGISHSNIVHLILRFRNWNQDFTPLYFFLFFNFWLNFFFGLTPWGFLYALPFISFFLAPSLEWLTWLFFRLSHRWLIFYQWA